MTIKKISKQIAQNAKNSSTQIANLGTDLKNQILLKVAKNLKDNIAKIIAANKRDVALAIQNNLEAAKIDRLTVDDARLHNLADAIVQIAHLPNPVGKVLYETTRPNGLHIKRVSVPIGVLLAIYEARPNVTSDIAALGFKSGNAVILRSGKECFETSKTIAEIYQNTLREFDVNPACISYVESTDRDYVKELLKLDDLIDVVVPRGGKDLIKAIMKNTKIPLFKHLDGNCHTYVQSSADLIKAVKIVANAKMRRVGICGATESLVIDKKIAAEFLPKIVDELNALGCEVRGDKIAQKLDSRIKAATSKDFYTEFLDKIISVKIVKDIDGAITHINQHSSKHTESIITEDKDAAKKFQANIGSAIVMHNASTQFADGGEFGLGAEVGISTGKLHARGPVGLEQLTTYKYVVEADCAVRAA
ncbi:MAG: glutamate-5-semialdehyde dehydrogenase [Rickettsiales bacterium]|jgi:glutamate-5-semialdehyde dehydrogenase